MFIKFDLGETFDVTYTIYLGNQPIKRIMMSGPRQMLEAQFMSFVQEITAQNQPMKVVMSREEIIWDQFEQKQKVLPLTVEFQNYQE